MADLQSDRFSKSLPKNFVSLKSTIADDHQVPCLRTAYLPAQRAALRNPKHQIIWRHGAGDAAQHLRTRDLGFEVLPTDRDVQWSEARSKLDDAL